MQGALFAGYDWQVAPKWVTGIEGDIAFGDSSMRRGGIPGTYGNGCCGGVWLCVPGIEAEQVDSATVKLGWDASMRARLGYLTTPNILVYGTGGVAFQQMSVDGDLQWIAAVLLPFDLVRVWPAVKPRPPS